MSVTALVLSAYLAFPLITIATGVVESDMNPLAVGRAMEKGAFQVIERHWGKVPKDLWRQAKQHNSILGSLVAGSGGDVWKAVERYNGSGPMARIYVKKVQKQVIELALLWDGV
jgi:hypothetical protein